MTFVTAALTIPIALGIAGCRDLTVKSIAWSQAIATASAGCRRPSSVLM